MCSAGKEERTFQHRPCPLLSSPKSQPPSTGPSLTTDALHHAPVEPAEAGAAGQHLLAHRVEVEGLAGLLDVLDVDDTAAVGPADEDVELG